MSENTYEITYDEVVSKIEPTFWRVLVELEVAKEKTDGGIILPAAAQEVEQFKISNGTIARLGSLAFKTKGTGATWSEDHPQVGDRVCFGKYAGQPIVVDGRRFVVVNDDAIFAKVSTDASINTASRV